MKIKSLAEEARIIRTEERKRRGPRWGPSELRQHLHQHRVIDVRREARASLIAYGFLRGRSYAQLEKPERPPGWSRVLKIVEKFGGEDVRVLRQRFSEWCDQAWVAKR